MHTKGLSWKKMVATSSFAGAAVLLGAGSTAWACNAYVANPYINSPQPNQARAGAQVQLSGANWAPTGPVQVQWDGAGDRVLAQATPAQDGSFSRLVTIPSAATPGSFSIVATQGTKTSTAVKVEVLAAPSANPTDSPPTQSSPQGSASVRTNGGSNGATAAPALTDEAPAPAGAIAAPAVAGPQPQPQPNQAGAPIGAPPADSGAASQPAAAAAAPQAAPQEQATASPKTPSRDLWSGFTDGQSRPAEELVKLPSSAAADSTLPIGIAVLVGGMVSMLAGFAVAGVRRRRAAA